MEVGSFFLRFVLKFCISFSASFCAASLGDRLLLAAEGVSGVLIIVVREAAPKPAELRVGVSHILARKGDLALCWVWLELLVVIGIERVLGWTGSFSDDVAKSFSWFRNMLLAV